MPSGDARWVDGVRQILATTNLACAEWGTVTGRGALRDSSGDRLWTTLSNLAVIAPLGTFIVAVAAGVANWQKARSDRRQAWWERARWTIDSSLSEDSETREAGSAALRAVQGFRLVTKEDASLLDSVAVGLQEELLEGLPSTEGDSIDSTGPDSEPLMDLEAGPGDNVMDERGDRND